MAPEIVPVLAAAIVKDIPLLDPPHVVTVTGPVVALFGTGAVMALALQVVGCDPVPLKLTLPPGHPKNPPVAPAVMLGPKPVPLMVIGRLVVPEPGDRPVITGITSKLPSLFTAGTPFTVT
jgi:hypothetical protein